MEDISGLKVADLRRELKDRGLPITGTKIELVSRLQEALTSEKPTSDDSALDDALLDEDSMLAGEDEDESGAEIETSDTENLSSLDLTSPITTTPPKAAAAKLTGALPTEATAKTGAAVDSKRNGAAQGTEDGSSAAKKIKISREPVQAPVAKQVTTTSPPKPVAAAVSPSADSADGSEASETAKKINIQAALAAVDRSKLREVKFGSADAATVAAPAATAAGAQDKRQQRAARFGIAATAAAASGTVKGSVKGPTALTPEEQARLEKRKERFGKELADVKESVEKAKEKRAQRFGGGAAAAAGGKVDEKKQQRAARFGA